MPQSEDKLALKELEQEIQTEQEYLEWLNDKVLVSEAKLIRLEGRKKSMENYLNGDNN